MIYGATSGLFGKLAREAKSTKGSIPMSRSMSSYAVDMSPQPREKALLSLFEKEEITQQKFQQGVMNFRKIQTSVSPEETLKEITEWYKENH